MPKKKKGDYMIFRKDWGIVVDTRGVADIEATRDYMNYKPAPSRAKKTIIARMGRDCDGAYRMPPNRIDERMK